tara:strand:+ start:471 stop:719 length:249 start_codon:yes stop_codon:yes gene_type:complete
MRDQFLGKTTIEKNRLSSVLMIAIYMRTIIAAQGPIVKKITKEELRMVTCNESRAKEEAEEAIKSIHKEKWVQHKHRPPINM